VTDWTQLTSTQRTRCDVGEGPLWCILLGGYTETEWKLARVALAQRYVQQQMIKEQRDY
jgi:hypothetical protein